MKLTLLLARDLGSDDAARWRALQLSSPALGSPCYSPGFLAAVDAVCDDVRVVVAEADGGIVGYFPFERRLAHGRPIGGHLSDHHGVVCAPTTTWSWPALLRAGRIGWFAYDHLPAAQAAPTDAPASSPGIDLSRGFAAWKQARGRRVAELDRKARKLAREVGQLRFVARSRDRAVLDDVLQKKTAQCARTGIADVFRERWARRLIHRVHDADDVDFGGCLSVLYAGDHVVAAHFGMRSSQVWHWWLPVYDHDHARFSPGALLLLSVAAAAADDGAALLDLGKGDDPYKKSFADVATPLAEGVALPEALRPVHAARGRGEQWLRASPIFPALRGVKRLAQRAAR
jgi:CelD/BcsL family acetyltransferase involved in cellulose biosynthesis